MKRLTALLATAVAAASTLAVPTGGIGVQAAVAGTSCTKDWQSPLGGSWKTGANWSGGTIPGKYDVVCIDADSEGRPYDVTLKGAARVAELRVGGSTRSAPTLRLLASCADGDAALTVDGPVAL